ncbi:uncharacterized protein At4g38062 [Dendrobium catenatum]|nr:uncharacterized protein At4g38062 [Dendrobium catenatum]
MEEACKELEEMRCEMEMLKAENKANYQHSESLRRAFEVQLVKLQNARVEIEQQAKEIDAKSEEISMVTHKYDDLQSSFQEKESALKQLSLSNESMRTGFKDKIKELEQVNKELVFALDEANVKAEEREKMVCGYKKEIEVLKGLLSESQKKNCDAELRAQAPKESRRRDEMLDELLKEKVEIEVRLKWKIEQFRHLEEALNKIQEEFQTSKKEWESEKSNLLNDISSLQSSLDFEIQVTNDLRSQLQMCNQALAHEESRRRSLEIQMHESKEMYENIALEYEEVKSKFETLTTRRDDEIASIRNSMSAKNTLLKELEFKNTYLKQENQELLESLKEAQEAQINGVDASSSLKSLRLKFRALELAHKECSDKLKAREVHWSQQGTKLTEELDECLLKLNSKDHEISDLKEELECSQCMAIQTRIESEEIFIINIILKSKFVEIFRDLKGFDRIVEQTNERAGERVGFLTKQLQNTSIALTKSLAEVSDERKKVDFLQSKVEQLEHVNGEYLSMQKELASSKGMLAELSRNIDSVKEQAAQKELDLQHKLLSVSFALEKANSSVSEKMAALDEVEFELEQQKIVVSQLKKVKRDLVTELKGCHAENHDRKRCMEEAILEKMEMKKVLKEVEENFLLLLEENERRVAELELIKVILEEHITKIDLDISAVPKVVFPQSVKKKIDELLVLLESVGRKLTFFEDAIDLLEQSHGTRDNGILINLEKFRAAYADFVEEKLYVISDIQQRILSYDGTANYWLDELDKLKAAQILDKQELHYKSLLISELQKGFLALLAKLESEEKLSDQLATEKFHLESELKRLRSNQRYLKEEIEAENKRITLHEVKEKFSWQRELFLEQITGLGDVIGKVSSKGEEVRKNWDKILQKTIYGVDIVTEMECDDLISCKMTHARKYTSAITDNAGEILNRRLPLEQNFNY